MSSERGLVISCPIRYYLEDIYERIISASDGELAMNKEIEKLEIAIRDHVKVSREAGFKLRLVDFDASLNLSGGAATGVAGCLAGLPLRQALLTGGVAALSLKIGPSLKRREVTNTPFKYMSSFQKKLF